MTSEHSFVAIYLSTIHPAGTTQVRSCAQIVIPSCFHFAYNQYFYIGNSVGYPCCSLSTRSGRISTVTVSLVLQWLDLGGIEGGLLFRSVLRSGRTGERLDESQVPRIYKSMARAAGLGEDAVARVSGHSTRVGAAQDMVAARIPMPAIMQAGRWKSTAMVSRYGERILPGRNGSAQLASLQERHLFPGFSGSGSDGFPGLRPESSTGAGKKRRSRGNGPGNAGRGNPGGREIAAPEPKTIGSGKSGKSDVRAGFRTAAVSSAAGFVENMTPPPSSGLRETAETGTGKSRFRARAAVDGGDAKHYSPDPDSSHYRERPSALKRFNRLFFLGFLFPLPHPLRSLGKKRRLPSNPGIHL